MTTIQTAVRSEQSDLEQYKDIYKAQIIEMAQKQEDALFLQQIYTIMIRRKRKTEA